MVDLWAIFVWWCRWQSTVVLQIFFLIFILRGVGGGDDGRSVRFLCGGRGGS